jgi:hypothetical protein
MTYWYGAEMDSHFDVQCGAAEFSPGMKIRISGKLGNKQLSHIVVVTAFERARLLEWQFQDAYGVRGRERWELEPLPGGRTSLRFTNEYEFPGRFARAVSRLLTRHSIARRNRDYLARLARLIERRD